MVEVFTLLLPLLLQFLPVLINKPKPARQEGLSKLVAMYQGVAGSPTADAGIRLLAGHAALAFGCMADADTMQECEAIFGKFQATCGAMMSAAQGLKGK